MKTYNHCLKEKPMSDFCKNKRRPDGKSGQCFPCRREMSNKWLNAHPGRFKEFQAAYRAANRATLKKKDRRQSLARRYGITVEEYEETLKAQNGSCAICHGQNMAGRRLAVDHNHDTGEVRGLLCNHCNVGIGYFKESPDLIRKVISYIESYKETTNEIAQ